jgi:hypothetical protein
MSEKEKEIIGTYVGGVDGDARVTVKWLEQNEDPDREDPREGNYVHLRIELWEDVETLDSPDLWSIDWCHFVGVLTDSLPRYLADNLLPDDVTRIEIAIESLWYELPDDLKGLFPRIRRAVTHDQLGYDS